MQQWESFILGDYTKKKGKKENIPCSRPSNPPSGSLSYPSIRTSAELSGGMHYINSIMTLWVFINPGWYNMFQMVLRLKAESCKIDRSIRDFRIFPISEFFSGKFWGGGKGVAGLFGAATPATRYLSSRSRRWIWMAEKLNGAYPSDPSFIVHTFIFPSISLSLSLSNIVTSHHSSTQAKANAKNIISWNYGEKGTGLVKHLTPNPRAPSSLHFTYHDHDDTYIVVSTWYIYYIVGLITELQLLESWG